MRREDKIELKNKKIFEDMEDDNLERIMRKSLVK